ncbi:Nex18 symbiotically induced protein [Balamuthia mandrillaris]
MTRALFALAAVLLVAFAAQAQAGTLFEALQADPEYSKFLAAVSNVAPLLDALNSDTAETTLFAPTDEVFSDATMDLLYFSFGKKLARSDFTDGDLLQMDNDIYAKVTVTEDEISVNNVPLVAGKDVECSNGVLYQISDVLTPPATLRKVAEEVGLTTLVSLFQLAGMEDALLQDDVTLFAPTDAAFAALPPVYLNYLLSNTAESNKKVSELLSAHMLSSATYSPDFVDGSSEVATLLDGFRLNLFKDENGLVVNNANVKTSDVLASNGVAHTVDAVILPTANETLREVLTALGRTEFIKAVDQAGLTDLLDKDTTPSTVFAPSNEAITKAGPLPSGQALTDLISYHFSSGSVPVLKTELLASLYKPKTLPNNQYLKVEVNKDSATVNGLPVDVVSGHVATNGVAYGLESVLAFPKSVPDVAKSNTTLPPYSPLTEFLALVKQAGLTDTLNTTANLTVFAPSNAAIKALPKTLLDSFNKDNLTALLKYHVLALPEVYYSKNFPAGETSLKTLQGSKVTVTVDATSGAVTVGATTFSAAPVIFTDGLAANGVIHVVDAVILPPTLNMQGLLNTVGRTSFVTALEQNNFTNVLTGTDSVHTTFAPTNDAIKKAGKDVTKSVLSYHVVDSAVMAAALKEGATLVDSALKEKGLGNNYQKLKVVKETSDTKTTTVTVNGVKVTAADLPATNGISHLIEGVVVPPSDLLTVLSNNKETFSTLLDAIKTANLTDTFAALTSTTVFAPTNKAFESLNPAIKGYLLLPNSTSDLTKVLTHHFGKQVVYSTEMTTGQTIPTLDGDDLVITKNSKTGEITVEDDNGSSATVVLPDVLASNGVAHGVDEVLLPENFNITFEKLLEGYQANKFLQLLTQTNLTQLVFSGEKYTLFAPTDEAFDKAVGINSILNNKTLLLETLSSHIHQGVINPDQLVKNASFSTLNPKTKIVVIQAANATAKTNARLALSTNLNLTAEVISYAEASYDLGYVFELNGVLGKGSESDEDKGGLSTTAIVLIVVGSIILVLVIVGVAGGGYYYYQKRSEYTTIEDGSF